MRAFKELNGKQGWPCVRRRGVLPSFDVRTPVNYVKIRQFFIRSMIFFFGHLVKHMGK